MNDDSTHRALKQIASNMHARFRCLLLFILVVGFALYRPKLVVLLPTNRLPYKVERCDRRGVFGYIRHIYSSLPLSAEINRPALKEQAHKCMVSSLLGFCRSLVDSRGLCYMDPGTTWEHEKGKRGAVRPLPQSPREGVQAGRRSMSIQSIVLG